jgi:hypothetical protein
LTNAAIAERLSWSPKTVRNFVCGIFSKLQVADRAANLLRARNALPRRPESQLSSAADHVQREPIDLQRNSPRYLRFYDAAFGHVLDNPSPTLIRP